MFYTYLLKSKKKEGEIYIGSTNNLKRRIDEHNEGREISTKRYKPWSLVYFEAYATEELARLREKRLKQHGNAKLELKKRVGLKSGRDGIYPAPLSHKSGAGFTLIELMVATSLFIVIVSVASATFVEALRTQRSTIQLTSANNNMSQSIEQMSREIRTGKDFSSSTEAELRFTNYKGELVSYKLLSDNTIGRCVSSCASSSDYIPITSDRNKIISLRFIYLGIEEGDDLPARITIAATLESTQRGPINFQTTVSAINI